MVATCVQSAFGNRTKEVSECIRRNPRGTARYECSVFAISAVPIHVGTNPPMDSAYPKSSFKSSN